MSVISFILVTNIQQISQQIQISESDLEPLIQFSNSGSISNIVIKSIQFLNVPLIMDII
jgi:hypothetical protein